MKKISEYKEEKAAEVLEGIKIREAKIQEFLGKLSPIQDDPHHTAQVREGVRDGIYKLMDLACDKCGTQLVSNVRQNFSNPPSMWYICCECGEYYLV